MTESINTNEELDAAIKSVCKLRGINPNKRTPAKSNKLEIRRKIEDKKAELNTEIELLGVNLCG